MCLQFSKPLYRGRNYLTLIKATYWIIFTLEVMGNEEMEESEGKLTFSVIESLKVKR